jgi:hypothetical protein
MDPGRGGGDKPVEEEAGHDHRPVVAGADARGIVDEELRREKADDASLGEAVLHGAQDERVIPDELVVQRSREDAEGDHQEQKRPERERPSSYDRGPTIAARGMYDLCHIPVIFSWRGVTRKTFRPGRAVIGRTGVRTPLPADGGGIPPPGYQGRSVMRLS